MKDSAFRDYYKRILAVLPLVVILSILLSGCVKKYYQSDIKSYAKKLTGRSNLSVSEGYVEIQEDEEGYLDHLWTVTDDDTGMEFHILDDYYWALEEVENRLLDDYDSSVFLWLLDQQKFPMTQGLYLRKSEESGLVNAEVICGFSDEKSMRALYEQLRSLREAAEKEGYENLKVRYTVQYDHFLRNVIEYEAEGGDTTGEIGSLDEDDYALMRKNFLACALDYRYDQVLQNFTDEEIFEVVHAPDSVRIYKTSDGGSGPEEAGREAAGSGATAGQQSAGDRIYYEGVIGNPKYAGISFGTLYELLRQEGRQVSGNAWHYSFTSPEGDQIEISYDFNDLSGYNDRDGKLRKGYYYMRGDKKVRMKNYYDNHFDTSEIARLTGLRVYEDRPYIVSQD